MKQLDKVNRFIGTVIIVVWMIGYYSCEAEGILIDTNLDLPPVPLETEGWEVAAYTSQEDMDGEGANNGRVANAIDGSVSTYWHTCWNECTPTPPHSFVVDMGSPMEFRGFFVTQRQSLSRNIKVCSIELSDDNSSWRSLGEFDLERIRPAQQIALESEMTARYFRFNVVEVYDGTNNAALAEIVPYL